MAKDRLIKILNNYIKIMSVLILIWAVLAAMSPLWFEGGRELCHIVTHSEYHHFLIDEYDACRVNWSYVIREPILTFALIYLILIAPAAVVGFWLRRTRKE
ncbi:MAG: hypothetical protein H6868_04820 [Rhodospirillales bacterium]|nr:hypothetical protein [Rhodospirillales bacterium]